MRIKTERFELRTLRSPDLDESYFRWLADPEITRYLTIYRSTMTQNDVCKYVDSHVSPNSCFFGIYDKNNLLIGTHSFVSSVLTRRCAIGGMIGDRTYWGKGVILETRSAILDHAFTVLRCEKAEAGCYKGNVAAVYNFVRQGRLHKLSVIRGRYNWAGWQHRTNSAFCYQIQPL